MQLKNIAKLWIAKCNLKLSKLDTDISLEGFFKKIKSMGIEINLIYDIGGYKGEWSEKVSRLSPGSEFLIFEPNKIHNRSINSMGFKNIINVPLASKEKIVTWYGNNTSGDSYYPESVNPKYSKAKKKTAYSLDYLYKSNKCTSSFPDLIKLDTQGSEIEILKGAKTILKNTKFVIMEMPIMIYNHGAPLFGEYVHFMLKNNFLPFQVIEEHRMHDILIQLDIAFINKNLSNPFSDRFMDLTNKFYNIPSVLDPK